MLYSQSLCWCILFSHVQASRVLGLQVLPLHCSSLFLSLACFSFVAVLCNSILLNEMLAEALSRHVRKKKKLTLLCKEKFDTKLALYVIKRLRWLIEHDVASILLFLTARFYYLFILNWQRIRFALELMNGIVAYNIVFNHCNSVLL